MSSRDFINAYNYAQNVQPRYVVHRHVVIQPRVRVVQRQHVMTTPQSHIVVNQPVGVYYARPSVVPFCKRCRSHGHYATDHR
jgi:hypothetical protein